MVYCRAHSTFSLVKRIGTVLFPHVFFVVFSAQQSEIPHAASPCPPLHVHVDAACPCCMSMTMLHASMLRIHVHAACPCLRVNAACSCPCCMFMSMMHVYVIAACPYRYFISMSIYMSVSMLHVHAILHVHAVLHAPVGVVYSFPCCISV
jgi:hypothetical protein